MNIQKNPIQTFPIEVPGIEDERKLNFLKDHDLNHGTWIKSNGQPPLLVDIIIKNNMMRWFLGRGSSYLSRASKWILRSTGI